MCQLLLCAIGHGVDGMDSLKNHGVDEEVDGMFDMGAETMRLPLEDKVKFKQGDEGVAISFGSVKSLSGSFSSTISQV